MSWPLRALIGPTLWAIAFSVIYATHGLGCAKGWSGQPAPLGDWHQFTLISLWLLSVGLAAAVLWRSPIGEDTASRIVRAGSWIGLISVTLTLMPVLGLTTCGAP